MDKNKTVNAKDNLNSLMSEMKSAKPIEGIDEDVLNKRIEFYYNRFQHYGYDDSEPRNLFLFAKYAAQYYSGVAKKGLCLVGETGRGKSFGFEIMKKHLFFTRIYYAPDLVDMWQVLGPKERNDIYKELTGNYIDRGRIEISRLWRDRCIDDIGAEPTLNEYGTKREVIDTIINKCVKEYEQFGALTHMTFNLKLEGNDVDSIQGRYGKRFVSRLHQICHVVTLSGKDRRLDK